VGRVKHTFQLAMASSLGIGRSLALNGIRFWAQGPVVGEGGSVTVRGTPNIPLIIVTREAADDYQS